MTGNAMNAPPLPAMDCYLQINIFLLKFEYPLDTEDRYE